MTIDNQWTRLVRFVGPDGQVRLGQPIDASIDVGLAVAAGDKVEVNIVEGSIFDGVVTSEKSTIEKLLGPVSRDDCTLIRCLGLNFMAHAKEANRGIPNEPILFIKPRTALAGPGDLPVAPVAQDQLDFETELALVIGKDARDVSEADALNYVLGYACSNDVSVRKLQLANNQWCFGKGFDDSCPVGPVLVRNGQINPDDLEFKGVLSGETMQASNTNDMIFSCAKAISFLSQGTTLERGTIILMGTPSGIGWARTPKRTIQNGEVMDIWFQGIGTLRNKFVFSS